MEDVGYLFFIVKINWVSEVGGIYEGKGNVEREDREGENIINYEMCVI